MTYLFIILSLVIIYVSLAIATFEKFTDNGLVPKSPVIAYIFTPILITFFYIRIALKAPSLAIAIDCLKLGTIRYPLGIGLFIEGVHLRREFAIAPNTQPQKIQKDKIIKAAVITNTPSIRIWKEAAIPANIY